MFEAYLSRKWGDGGALTMPFMTSLPPAGYLLALGPLLFISICDVWLQLFSHDQAYAINLAAVGTVAFGCTGREWGQDALGGLSPSALWPYKMSQFSCWPHVYRHTRAHVHSTHMHTNPHMHQGDSYVAQVWMAAPWFS